MMEFRKLLRIIFVAMVVAGLVLATGAMASSPAAGGDPNEVVSRRSKGSETRMLTAAEMSNALPAPMPEVSGGPVFAEADVLPEGDFGVVPGGLGEGKGEVSLDLLGEEVEVEPAFSPKNQAYSYPPPFTRYEIYPFSWVKSYPHRTIGKLYFKSPDGGTYVCSGGVAVGRAVWTAGHCVYNNDLVAGKNGWNTNLTFCPARRNGVNPYGCWTAFTKATLVGWKTNNKMQYDIGMIAVRDKAGKKIGQRVGWLGAMWNASSLKHWHDFGYPHAAPFNGEKQYVCAASRAWRDAYFGTPYTNGIGCDMTGGCSGGPWLVKYEPNKSGARNYANSVNSYRWIRPSQPKAIHGPYFGNGARNLYLWGKGK